jgi:hypothetical protein
MQHVMEIAKFRVTAAFDHASVLERAASIEPWLRKQPGFVRRSLVGPDDEGTWTDLVHWESKASALSAAEAIGKAPELGGFMEMIDGDSVSMQHLAIANTIE